MEYPKPFLSMTKEKQDQQIATWQTEIEQLRLLPETPKTIVTISQTLVNIGRYYTLQNKYVEAKPLLLEALALSRTPNLPYRPNFAGHLNYIAINNTLVVQKQRGKYVNSKDFFNDLELLDIWRRLQGSWASMEQTIHNFIVEERSKSPIDYSDLFVQLKMQGSTLRQQDRLEDAEPYYLEALDLGCKMLPTDDHEVALTPINLGVHYQEQFRYAEAEPYFLAAQANITRLCGQDHEDTTYATYFVEKFYKAWEEYKKKCEKN